MFRSGLQWWRVTRSETSANDSLWNQWNECEWLVKRVRVMRCGGRAQKPNFINDKEALFKVRRRWLLQHYCHKVPVLHVLKYHYMVFSWLYCYWYKLKPKNGFPEWVLTARDSTPSPNISDWLAVKPVKRVQVACSERADTLDSIAVLGPLLQIYEADKCTFHVR